MSDKLETKKFNRVMLGVLGAIVVIGTIVGVCILAGAHGDAVRQAARQQELIDILKNNLQQKGHENKKLHDLITKLKENQQIPDEQLLERDIFVYLDQEFQLTPRTTAKEIAHQIVVKSREHQVSPELVLAIIQVESTFNPSAISSANARGLMQVMPEWAKKFGLRKVSDLHDIDTGIDCGIKVLKIHVDEEGGNLTRGLFKYVGGSDTYANKVYIAMGEFVAYRSNIEKEETEQANGSTDGGTTNAS